MQLEGHRAIDAVKRSLRGPLVERAARLTVAPGRPDDQREASREP
jgi:hypothetical protein